jgi:hypothetical protein
LARSVSLHTSFLPIAALKAQERLPVIPRPRPTTLKPESVTMPIDRHSCTLAVTRNLSVNDAEELCEYFAARLKPVRIEYNGNKGTLRIEWSSNRRVTTYKSLKRCLEKSDPSPKNPMTSMQSLMHSTQKFILPTPILNAATVRQITPVMYFSTCLMGRYWS